MKKRLLITGANRGLGRSIAEAFLADGWRVAMLNRTLGGPPGAMEIPCDLRDGDQIHNGFNAAIARMGGLDVCIANAAVRNLDPVERMSPESWDESVAVNLSSVFRLAHLAIPELRASDGHLIIVGSHAGSHYFEGGAAYCATKAALKALHEVIVLETRDCAMRSTLLSAGAIRNRPMENDDWKIRPQHIAAVLRDIVSADTDAYVGEVEVRPTRPLISGTTGMGRLQTL